MLIVVRRGEEYLVVHRSPQNDAYWHLIAGGVEDDETFAAAAARELHEETGLAAIVEPLDRSFAYEGVHVECFVAEAPEAWEPTLDWEHDDYRWCDPDEADALLHWADTRHALQELLGRP